MIQWNCKSWISRYQSSDRITFKTCHVLSQDLTWPRLEKTCSGLGQGLTSFEQTLTKTWEVLGKYVAQFSVVLLSFIYERTHVIPQKSLHREWKTFGYRPKTKDTVVLASYFLSTLVDCERLTSKNLQVSSKFLLYNASPCKFFLPVNHSSYKLLQVKLSAYKFL